MPPPPALFPMPLPPPRPLRRRTPLSRRRWRPEHPPRRALRWSQPPPARPLASPAGAPPARPSPPDLRRWQLRSLGPAAPTGAASDGTGSAIPSPKGAGGGPSAPTPAPLPGGGTTVGVTKDSDDHRALLPQDRPVRWHRPQRPGGGPGGVRRSRPDPWAAPDPQDYDDGTANASTIQVEEKRARTRSSPLMSGVGETNVVLAPLADQHKVPSSSPTSTSTSPSPHLRLRRHRLLERHSHAPSLLHQEPARRRHKKHRHRLRGHQHRQERQAGLQSQGRRARPQRRLRTADRPVAVRLRQRGGEPPVPRVELVVMLNGPLGAICMLRDAKALGYKPTWTGVGLSWNLNIVATGSGGAADGIRHCPPRTRPWSRRRVALLGASSASTCRTPAPNRRRYLMLLRLRLRLSFIEGLRRTGPDLTREAFVQTFETKMNGYARASSRPRPSAPATVPARWSGSPPAAPTASGPPRNPAGAPPSDQYQAVSAEDERSVSRRPRRVLRRCRTSRC